MSEGTLWRVADLLVDHQRVRPESRIERDLGITGDDAAELMEAFMQVFGADMTGFVITRHFGPEGSGCFLPVPVLRRVFREYRELDRYEPVTVAHLAEVAERGKWFDPPLKARR